MPSAGNITSKPQPIRPVCHHSLRRVHCHVFMDPYTHSHKATRLQVSSRPHTNPTTGGHIDLISSWQQMSQENPHILHSLPTPQCSHKTCPKNLAICPSLQAVGWRPTCGPPSTMRFAVKGRQHRAEAASYADCDAGSVATAAIRTPPAPPAPSVVLSPVVSTPFVSKRQGAPDTHSLARGEPPRPDTSDAIMSIDLFSSTGAVLVFADATPMELAVVAVVVAMALCGPGLVTVSANAGPSPRGRAERRQSQEYAPPRTLAEALGPALRRAGTRTRAPRRVGSAGSRVVWRHSRARELSDDIRGLASRARRSKDSHVLPRQIRAERAA
jgi:hypothetical protein